MVLNSFPGMVVMLKVAVPAGDCVGLGRYTTVPAFGLLLLSCWGCCCCGCACWLKDCRRLLIPLRSSSCDVEPMALLFVTSNTSCGCCWNGDCDGEGCSRGLAGIDGDGLGVRNGPGGDNIPGLSNDCRRFIGVPKRTSAKADAKVRRPPADSGEKSGCLVVGTVLQPICTNAGSRPHGCCCDYCCYFPSPATEH